VSAQRLDNLGMYPKKVVHGATARLRSRSEEISRDDERDPLSLCRLAFATNRFHQLGKQRELSRAVGRDVKIG
jgi:hypothetical protein